MSRTIKIEFATPQRYRRMGKYWERDGGLLAVEGRRLGIDTSYVMLPGDQPETDVPLVTGSEEEMSRPGWWRIRSPAAVVLYAWGMPRYAPIARAIRDAGIRLQVQFDSDGVISPRVALWPYLRTAYWTYREYGFRGKVKTFPSVVAVLNTLWHFANRRAYDEPMTEHLACAGWIGLESPIAAERVKRFLARMGRGELVSRVVVSCHPVDERFTPGEVAKEPVIIAVGRWLSEQKDGALLMRVLRRTLAANPLWRAVVIGAGGDRLAQETVGWTTDCRNRFSAVGGLSRDAVLREMQRARILLATSRYESFHIAAAEALCCGATVVAPPGLPSFSYFASEGSGVIADSRGVPALSAALTDEIRKWEEGSRSADVISRVWGRRLTATTWINTLLQRLATCSSPELP